MSERAWPWPEPKVATIDAADVLRMQADLRDRFRDPLICDAVSAQWSVINDDMPNMPPELIGQAMSSGLTHATAYRVEQQMTDLIIERAAGLADDTPMSSPPRPLGFVVFEKPLTTIELRNRIERIHAITWAPAQIAMPSGIETTGLLITTWNDLAREPDEVYTEAVAPRVADPTFAEQLSHFGRWSLAVIRPLRMFDHVGPADVPTPGTARARLDAEGWTGSVADATTNALRYLSALFDMLSERVPAARSETPEPSRGERKQAKREGLRPEVVTVALRPEYKPAHEYRHDTGRQVGVRYGVGTPEIEGSVAFYRTIHRGTPRERRVPVRSHYRGPEGGPTGPRKVYTLAR